MSCIKCRPSPEVLRAWTLFLQSYDGKCAKYMGFSNVLWVCFKEIRLCMSSSRADIFRKCPRAETMKSFKSLISNVVTSIKCWKGGRFFYSVLWLHTEDVQKYCETTVKMNTGTESIVITSENDLSHTHLEADSQLFFPVARLELPERFFKTLWRRCHPIRSFTPMQG